MHILDRDSLEVLTSFGEGGRQPGEFYGRWARREGLHAIARLAEACRTRRSRGNDRSVRAFDQLLERPPSAGRAYFLRVQG